VEQKVNWLKIARLCALFPLFTGVFIFGLWLLTYWDWLMLAGWFTVLGGLLLFLAGSIALLLYVRQSKKTQTPYARNTWKTGGLLLANFPVALAIMGYVGYLMFGYWITVANHSPQPVEVTLTDPLFVPGPETLPFGTVAAGASETKRFQFKGEGSVKYIVRFADGHEQSDVLIGYVTGGSGGKATLTVEQDGTITAKEDFGQK
jgi:hypothetical protein